MASAHSIETAKAVKEQLDKGVSIYKISQIQDMPTAATIHKWIRENRYGVFDEGEGTKPKQAGKPSIYSEDIANEILIRVMENESLRSICADDHMPSVGTIMKWRRENKNEFGSDYMMAFEARLWYAAEEIMDIADDGTNDYVEKETRNGTVIAFDAEHVQRSKLRVDVRKWLLSKLIGNFNDKSTIDHTSSDGTMSPSQEPTSFEVNFIEAKAPELDDEDEGYIN